MKHPPLAHQRATSQPTAQREANPGSGHLSAQLTQSTRQAAQRRELEDLRATPVQRQGLRTLAPSTAVVQLELDDEDVDRAVDAAVEYWQDVFNHISKTDSAAIRDEAKRLNKTGSFKKYSVLTTQLKAWIDTKALERKQARDAEQSTRALLEEKALADPEKKVDKPSSSSVATGGGSQPKGVTGEQKKPKEKRNKYTEPLSLGQFYSQTKDRNMWQNGDDSKVKAKVESAPLSASALLPDYSKIDRTADVKAKLDAFDPKQNKQGGAKGGGLNVDEVRAIIDHASQLTKFPYVLKGEGSGGYKTRLQLKFITHVKSSPSNITFHLSITQDVFDALTEIEEGDPK